MAVRVVCDSPLRAHALLVGQPLASPMRRISGFLFDAMLLVVPSLLVIVASVTLWLSVTDPAALRALRSNFSAAKQDPAEAAMNLGHLAPLLVRNEAVGLPPDVAKAVENADLKAAGEMLSGYSLDFIINPDEHERVPKPGHIRLDVAKLIPGAFRGAAFFGTAALYFTFFASGRRRSTPGKRLMGTEVVKLDGRPLTLWESFERFGGYLASVGTFGLGLLDLWRDENRRLAHDRLSNTVVVRR